MISFATILVPIITNWIQQAAPAITRKVFGESVDDQVKLEQAAIARLQALAALDNPYGTPSKWVVNLRASFRYIAAAFLIIGGLVLAAFGADQSSPALITTGIDLAASPFGFIFGERLVLTFKSK